MFNARHRGWITNIAAWPTMIIKNNQIAAAAKKFEGTVMFPTTHDITPTSYAACLRTLKNLLKHGNAVLIVSKPHLQIIKKLCKALAPFREQIQFRFTIGSLVDATCKLWEPGAPPPSERIEALKYAFKNNFATSVSMEPMLGDNAEMCRLVAVVEPYVTETIWLGKLNRGVSSNGMTPAEKLSFEVIKKALRNGQSDANILALVATLANNPKVRWKDSIKEVIAAANGTVATVPTAPPDSVEALRAENLALHHLLTELIGLIEPARYAAFVTNKEIQVEALKTTCQGAQDHIAALAPGKVCLEKTAKGKEVNGSKTNTGPFQMTPIAPPQRLTNAGAQGAKDPKRVAAAKKAWKTIRAKRAAAEAGKKP